MSEQISSEMVGKCIGMVLTQIATPTSKAWASDLGASDSDCLQVVTPYMIHQACQLVYSDFNSPEYQDCIQNAASITINNLDIETQNSTESPYYFLANRALQWGIVELVKIANKETNLNYAALLKPRFLYASIANPKMIFDYSDMRPDPDFLRDLAEMLTDEGKTALQEAESGKFPLYPEGPDSLDQMEVAAAVLIKTDRIVLHYMQNALGKDD